MKNTNLHSTDVQEKIIKNEMEIEIEEDDSLQIEDLLHTVGSFSVIVTPIAITMLLASFFVVNINDKEQQEEITSSYLVYKSEDKNVPMETKVQQAFVNALTLVFLFSIMTFVIVACYKFKFTKCLVGYMLLSSVSLLGLLGGRLLLVSLNSVSLPIDSFTFTLLMYNFAVVGVIAIFYQKGFPMSVTQCYLVATSIIMSWNIGKFPEWTAWALLSVLSFYDLCAVLTPCGPLKWLVHLIQQEGRPLPGLLYEAEVPHQFYRSTEETSVQTTTINRNETKKSEEKKYNDAVVENETESLISQKNDGHVIYIKKEITKDELIIVFKKYDPENIHTIDDLLIKFEGRHNELKDYLRNKYLNSIIEEDEDEDDYEEERTIKLGLGDFVFYSVLVSRAAMYDFSAMTGCFISILMGLGGTLILLIFVEKALPALPISILLGITVYFWIRQVLIPFIQDIGQVNVFI